MFNDIFIYYYNKLSLIMEGNKRLLALDVFRGITVAFMIIVNNPGSWNTTYSLLKHSDWNGCTPTDLVFPFFMFIVGAAMWYSHKKFGHTLSTALTLKILKRTFIIYLIGLSLTAYSVTSLDITKLRLMGVLPRIALAYGIVSFIVLLADIKWIPAITGIILLLYWGILIYFGGDAPLTLEGNFVRKFDIAVLGINHIPVFHGVTYDQTGLLSTLPSLANVLLGFLAGRLIDVTEKKTKAAVRLILWGIAGIVAALLWDRFFPINKPLWTSSFVLYTCGFASAFFGSLLWIIDVKGLSVWSKPFMIFGLNPLFLYVVAGVLSTTLSLIPVNMSSGESITLGNLIFSKCFTPIAGPYMASLLYAIIFMLICWMVGWILYRKNVIIKI
jgi:predicted acyltransferase